MRHQSQTIAHNILSLKKALKHRQELKGNKMSQGDLSITTHLYCATLMH